MAAPQRGIFEQDSIHHHYLEYAAGTAERPRLVAALARAVGDARAVSEASDTRVVVAFGAEFMRRIAPGGAPEGLRDFVTIEGIDGMRSPATQRDILFWIHGTDIGDTLDAALAIDHALAGVASLELDEKGFTYHDSRDLTGFIDGTANPKAEAARTAALIADGEAGAGGAFVLTQRWIHDLDAFGELSVADQERVIGRTKPDSIELEGDAMPADSHVSRTDVSGAAIYRRSAPFGSVGDKGLYFLAFTCDIERFDIQLRRMFGTAGDGIRDHLTDFSRPDTGAYWFAPSDDALSALLKGA